MQTQLRSRLFHTERNLSKNSLQPLGVSVAILNACKRTLRINQVILCHSLSVGESCTDPSSAQQIQEPASVFVPPVSDPSHEVKSITATLTEINNVSTLTAHCSSETEAKWCSCRTCSAFRTFSLVYLFRWQISWIPIIWLEKEGKKKTVCR